MNLAADDSEVILRLRGESSILATNDNIAGMALMAMALNVSGSIGDLMVAYKVRRYGRWTLFEDTKDGFIWYIPSING